MDKTRFETFTDGVIVVAMTLMVLQIVAPSGAGWGDLWGLRYRLIVYGLSFFIIAVYWKNHHHLLAGVEKISGLAMWINIALLFFLTLFAFTTAWVDENVGEVVPEVTFGVVMLMANLSFLGLEVELVRVNRIRRSRRWVVRYVLTFFLNLVGLGMAFWWPPAMLVATLPMILMWVVPVVGVWNTLEKKVGLDK
jgi:uncharacterized membrane protein